MQRCQCLIQKYYLDINDYKGIETLPQTDGVNLRYFKLRLLDQTNSEFVISKAYEIG